MIRITKLYRNNELFGFQIEGHAGYSIPGRDIVCAAVSTITLNTINSITMLSNAEMDIKESRDGFIQYTLTPRPGIIADTLLKSANIGYKSIAEQYPENVSVIERQ